MSLISSDGLSKHRSWSDSRAIQTTHNHFSQTICASPTTDVRETRSACLYTDSSQ